MPIRKAVIRDVPGIHKILNYYAEKDLYKTVNIIKGWVSESQEEEEE